MRSRLERGAGVLAVAALGVVCAPSAAWAQRDPAAAEALFRQGREAAEAGDHATACARFEESNRLDPAVGTLFNIADCKEQLGLLATAWTLFQEVAQKVPAGDDRQRIALERARALDPRLPRLTVEVEGSLPEGARVRRGQVALGSASLGVPLPIDPGKHEVVVEAPGHEPARYPIELAEGQRLSVRVQAGPVRAGGPDSGAGTAGGGGGDPVADSGSGGDKTLGWIVGGIGVVGLGVGAVTGVMTLGKKSEADDNCPDKQCNQAGIDAVDSGKTLGTVSGVSFAVGLVGVGLGAYLLLSGDAPEQRGATTLHPVVTPGGSWVGLRHRF